MGGHISIRNQKKAFTLVEIVVVMAITAALSMTIMSAFTRSRDFQITNHLLEDLKSEARVVQNNAMTVQGTCPSGSRPKMWSLRITTTQSSKRFFCTGVGGGWFDVPNSVLNFNDFVDTVNLGGGTVLNLIYSAPTGKFQLRTGNLTNGSLSSLPEDEIYELWVPQGGTRVTSFPRTVEIQKSTITLRFIINAFGGTSSEG